MKQTLSYYQINNPIINLNEYAFESDTGKYKVGDGVSRWSDLKYVKPEYLPEAVFNANLGFRGLAPSPAASDKSSFLTASGDWLKISGIDTSTGTLLEVNENSSGLMTPKLFSELKQASSNIQDLYQKLSDLGVVVFYAGSVDDYSDLPSNPKRGAMYNVKNSSDYGDAGSNFIWNGMDWDNVGGFISTITDQFIIDQF